ncbi:MAG: T9SS type A sorting domain-containing protein [Flavobacterium sp.]|nr:T9SS type A sorting domain-containing protein [Flavobacterium sp.]
MKNLINVLLLLLTTNNLSFSQCFSKISAGGPTSSAINPDGSIYTWGNGSLGSGALGLGHFDDVLTPTQVIAFNNCQNVSTGAANTFIIKNNGTLWGAGSDAYSELGDGYHGLGYNVPNFIQVGTATNWKQVSANELFVAGLKTNGTIWTWGINDVGQLGNGSGANQYVPTQVGTATNWKKVVTTAAAILALKTDGSLWAWGANPELGIDDSSVQGSLVPIQVGSFNGGTFTDYQDIASGAQSRIILAIRNNGQLWAWGTSYLGNFGGLGQGTNVGGLFRPTRIGTDSNWAFIAVGTYSSYAIKTDGTLWAWGGNSFGQVGDGTTIARGYPVQIGTDTNWASVAGGYGFANALKTDGSLWTWGDATYGQLGVGSYTSSLVPVPIAVAGCNLANESFTVQSERFVISPNPTKNTLTITNTANIKEINIYNTLGQLLQTFTQPSKTIDVSNLQSGNYFMKIVTESGVGIEKFIKE